MSELAEAQNVHATIHAIERLSVLELDTLGVGSVRRVFEDYAAALSITTEQLTEIEKKQALAAHVCLDHPEMPEDERTILSRVSWHDYSVGGITIGDLLQRFYSRQRQTE